MIGVEGFSMRRDEYLEEIAYDLCDFARENYDFDTLEALRHADNVAMTQLYEDTIISDVTGNGSGSYTFSRVQACDAIRDVVPLLYQIDTEEFAQIRLSEDARIRYEEFYDTVERLSDIPEGHLFKPVHPPVGWLFDNPEACDVIIRCYLLPEAIQRACNML